MGIVLEASCKHCEYYRRFFIGVGFGEYLEHVFSGELSALRRYISSPEERLTIKDLLQAVPPPEVRNESHSIYQCPYCNKLEEQFYFELHGKDFLYTPPYYCSCCDTLLKPILCNWLTFCSAEELKLRYPDHSPAVLPCPNCGTPLQVKDGHFDWD